MIGRVLLSVALVLGVALAALVQVAQARGAAAGTLVWPAAAIWAVAMAALGLLLWRLVEPLRAYAITVAGEAKRIAEAAQATSVAVTQQASSVRETTTTVRELQASMAQTRDVAQGVFEVAETSVQAGEEGTEATGEARRAVTDLGDRVDATSATIGDLADQIQRVGQILTAVNDLAEQSKFLSLNAAIEAARAGDHGRGFGVVALEVRNLAQQSQEATAQVRGIVETITGSMQQAIQASREGLQDARSGAEVVGRAEGAIRDLSEVIKRSREGAAQILASVNQQTLGIEQIAGAMEQIDSAVDQNVRSAEDAADIARRLREASHDLERVVGGLGA